MRIDLNGVSTFASTGGRDFDPSGDVILFIHGSGQNHLGYQFQHRYFANRGWQSITPDMPGHGQSDGAPLTSIEAMTDWLIAFMDAAGIAKAHMAGHSQGGLVLLDLASRHADRVQTASFLATAQAIPVNDYLLGLAEHKEPKAITSMMDWGHGAAGHKHDHTMPGVSHMAYGSQLMASNVKGALFADLSACAAYGGGAEASANITCPTLCVLSGADKMTPIKAGRALHAALGGDKVELPDTGHMNITESPFEVNKALRGFLDRHRA
ncbi:MAG: alpha/beta fold hydrolase [Planktomarina sp.]